MGTNGFVRARRRRMNRLGNQFLARSTLAVNQHRGAGRRHLSHQIEHREHFFALPDDVRKVVALLQGALELDILFTQAPALDGLCHLDEQFVVGPRLGDVIQRAAFERRPGHIDGAVGRDQHDGKIRIAAANFAQQVESVAVGEADVEEDQVERNFLEHGEARFARFGARGRVAFRIQQKFQALTNFGFVVDNQDGALRHERLSGPPEIPAGTMCLCPAWSAHPLFRRVP